jgi:AcrR family transcriptional regulator
MLTKNVKSRRRGRPRGESAKGAATKQRLYEVAVSRIASRGYEAATLRDVAREAGVSAALLYRYFPSKRAVVLALYDDLSAEYARQGMNMRPGRWRDRFVFALKTSLDVLAPQRPALQALIPVLVSPGEEGLFAPGTGFSRVRVVRVFEEAVAGATDAPAAVLARPLGRMLYVVHLLVLLWWLLDRSPRQRATVALVGLFRQLLPSVTLTLRLPPVRRAVMAADALVQDGLFDIPSAG